MADLSKPYPIGPFKLGMNNRLPETDLSTKEGRFVRSAVNIDIDSVGQFSRRNGSAKIISGTDCHSLWSDSSNTFAYYVDGTTLYQIINGVASVVTTGLTPGVHMSFDNVNNVIYYSNGVQTGRIVNGVNHSWGLPLPPKQFTLTAVPGAGTLSAGTYRLYSVYITADGQESGSSDVQSITLTSTPQLPLGTGGTRNADVGTNAITITGLPTVAPVADVVGVTLYMTPPGSEIFYRITGAIGFSGTYTVATQPDPDLIGRTQGFAPMPAGTIVRYYNARMITVLGNVLFYSEPYSLSLHNPADDFIPFPTNITLLMPVQDGVYVCADQTYWLKGELADTELIPALPYGGVAQSDVIALEENAVYWRSVRGLMKGDDSGKITPLTEANNAMDAAVQGASIHREQDGVRQLISSGFGISTTGVAASTYMAAEIIRKATIL